MAQRADDPYRSARKDERQPASKHQLEHITGCRPQRQSYADDYTALADEAARQDVGLMIIKTVSRRNWPESQDHNFTTWYEPFADDDNIRAAVSWVLSFENITGLATAGDVKLLGSIVDAEADPLSREDAEAVLARATEYSSPFSSMPW